MSAEKIIKNKRLDPSDGNPKLTYHQKEASKKAKDFAMRELNRWEARRGRDPNSYVEFDKYIREKIRRGEHLEKRIL